MESSTSSPKVQLVVPEGPAAESTNVQGVPREIPAPAQPKVDEQVPEEPGYEIKENEGALVKIPSPVTSTDTQYTDTDASDEEENAEQEGGSSGESSGVGLRRPAEGERDGADKRVRIEPSPVRAEVAHGMVSEIGKRRYMEDAVAVVPGFIEDLDFYAVYDGHGGDGVAKLCKERMHVLLSELVTAEEWDGDWSRTLITCFKMIDKEVLAFKELKFVGSTAVVVIVTAEEIIVANCGDSRAVLSSNGVAVPLSQDQKPERPDERARIEAAGGKVIYRDGDRILGLLDISRTIGDYYLKPFVIPEPEITIRTRTNRDEFLIVATDGLWNSLSSKEACNLVRQCFTGVAPPNSAFLGSSRTAEEAAALLVEQTYLHGAEDNTSVVVVKLKNLDSDVES
ncbi:hypothetical protein J5N97_028166 [Dioscorea zingiberensis]|uniref:protein-serine/threonine phosphatase n=1 Tax=Dioscorea zingiberensis TaxID=325984 RepID=A0A9D5BYK3_9LILI|nr:hypothetical protein J5N97_028166 [Dioscorea zingiberensis]